MPSSSNRQGRGWFIAATVLLGITGVLHTIGQFGPDPPELHSALAAAREAHFPMGMGMAPSLMDILSDLAFTMSITFFALTAMNLVIAFHADATTALRRTAAAVSVAWLLAFDVLCYIYRIPPPLISGVIVTIAFAVAFARSKV
jgi:hypothetical protein